MLLDLIDYRNSIIKKILHKNKVDPGNFSFLESGWWALHAAAITGIFMLGHEMAKKDQKYRK